MISNELVLTAAHCITKIKLKIERVRLGEWNTSTTLDCLIDDPQTCMPKALNIGIKRIFVHENYEPDSKDQNDDIALIQLKTKVTFNDYIKPVCLPLHGDIRNKNNFDGEVFVANGWGKTENDSRSNVKLKVNLPYFPQQKCIKIYEKFGKNITDKQMCIGGVEGKDTW